MGGRRGKKSWLDDGKTEGDCGRRGLGGGNKGKYGRGRLGEKRKKRIGDGMEMRRSLMGG